MAKDREKEARERAMSRIREARSKPADSAERWIEQVAGGDRGALARCISIVESARPEDRPLAEALLGQAVQCGGHARRYGITGIPGAGKSTWIEAAGITLVERGHRVAVLAVDPSSGRTGGSLLGDKTRMATLAQHPQAFVRPSPSGKTLGGIAAATGEAALLCEAAGFDRILIETVGVGQSETEVRRMTDLFMLMLIPGGGDGVQGIKRGILEWADAVWVNKADGGRERIEAAGATLNVYRSALSLLAAPAEGEPPLFGQGSALDRNMVAEWIGQLEARLDDAAASGSLHARRRRQMMESLDDLLEREALLQVRNHPQFPEAWQRLQDDLPRLQTLPFAQVRQLLEGLD